MRFLRRKAIYAGVLGGNRKWLIWGGVAWVLHGLRSLFGGGSPQPVFTQQLDPGERAIVLHNPAPPRKARRVRRRA